MNIRPEGRELARQLNCSIVEASTTTGYSVEDAFATLVREIRMSSKSEFGYLTYFSVTDH